MTEAQAILQLPRTASQIAGELEAARHEREMLRKLAGEFAALDFRPMVVFPNSDMMPQRIGPDPVPSELRNMLRAITDKVLALEYQYVAMTRQTYSR